MSCWSCGKAPVEQQIGGQVLIGDSVKVSLEILPIAPLRPPPHQRHTAGNVLVGQRGRHWVCWLRSGTQLPWDPWTFSLKWLVLVSAFDQPAPSPISFSFPLLCPARSIFLPAFLFLHSNELCAVSVSKFHWQRATRHSIQQLVSIVFTTHHSTTGVWHLNLIRNGVNRH